MASLFGVRNGGRRLIRQPLAAETHHKGNASWVCKPQIHSLVIRVADEFKTGLCQIG